MTGMKQKRVREPACKPGSVQPAKTGLGSHSSGMSVTRHLKQPTRIQCGSHLQDSYLVLLQAGFTVPWTVTSHAVRSYRTLSPLPASVVQHRLRRSTLCCTFRRLSPPRRYLAPYPLEPGLSSLYTAVNKNQRQVNSDCPASSLAQDSTYLGPVNQPSPDTPRPIGRGFTTNW